MRVLLAFLLFVTAAILAWWGVATVDNIWNSYKDSTDWTYLMFGLPLIGMALVCVVSGVVMLRRP